MAHHASLPSLGSVVNTKHGSVSTDHVLFICSGAFHSSKPSDMLAELQGRLPIRVELKGLVADDMYRILTEPEVSMLKQHQVGLSELPVLCRKIRVKGGSSCKLDYIMSDRALV